MKNEELQKRITEMVLDKIAIFELEKEEKEMKKNARKLVNIAATIIITIGLSIGTVYAGSVIYEKIWKEPARLDTADNGITEEIIKKNIPEDEARKIAQDKLIQLGLKDEEIIDTNHYRSAGTETIDYRFITNNWQVTINGKTGEFYGLDLITYDKSVENYTMTREEAIRVAREYYKKLGYQDDEYEFAELVPLWDYEENSSGNYSARFYKKYGDLYNVGESVWISFYAKDYKLHGYRVENHKCENNPIEITKEQAIEIATNEDRKIESKPIIKTSAKLQIRAMNGNAYARLNNTEEYYKPMTTIDVPSEEIVTYKTEDRIRIVWVVVIEYSDENVDTIDQIAKGEYSYYVDATTGEIIGGDASNELNQSNKNKITQ